MNAREIVWSLSECGAGSYSVAFKLLGFLVFLAEEGPEPFLSGEVMSPRTYFRWIEGLRHAGLADLALDARMRQLIQEYIGGKFGGLPINQTRERVLETVGEMIGEEAERSLQAMGRQATDRVQGERSEAEGREAGPTTLDAGVTGGSLRQSNAQRASVSIPRPVIRG